MHARVVDCGPGFSFQFDFIQKIDKQGPGASFSRALHRLCTLIRRQSAVCFIEEDVCNRPDVKTEIEQVEQRHFVKNLTNATSYTFFAQEVNIDDLSTLEKENILAQIVIIDGKCNTQFTNSSRESFQYIHEAVIRTPRNPAGIAPMNYCFHYSNFIQITFCCMNFQISGFLFAQQNGMTSWCAHAAVRMLFGFGERLSNFDIDNEIFGINGKKNDIFLSDISLFAKNRFRSHVASFTPMTELPCSGEEHTQQAEKVWTKIDLEKIGKRCIMLSSRASQMAAELVASVGSGFPALVGFSSHRVKSGNSVSEELVKHVLPVVGYIQNFDHWHAISLHDYFGEKRRDRLRDHFSDDLEDSEKYYYPSFRWTSHFLINDDNLGPLYSLSIRDFFEETYSHACVMIFRPGQVTIDATKAECIAHRILKGLGPILLKDQKSDWAKYLSHHVVKDEPDKKPLLRTRHLTARQYLDHLKKSMRADSQDDEQVFGQEMMSYFSIPGLSFWMTEFSLVEIYASNRSKFGEVLIRCDPPCGTEDPNGRSETPNGTQANDLTKKLLFGIRVISSMFLYDRNQGRWQFFENLKIQDYTHIYRYTPISNEW